MQTPESSLETLTNRIARLETQNRRLKKTGIALLLVAAAVIAMGQAPAKKLITANEFVLQDESGTIRARMSMEMKDRPTLSFYRDQTHVTASLAGGDEPFLVLFRAGTTEEVTLGANKGFYGLGLYEKEVRLTTASLYSKDLRGEVCTLIRKCRSIVEEMQREALR